MFKQIAIALAQIRYIRVLTHKQATLIMSQNLEIQLKFKQIILEPDLPGLNLPKTLAISHILPDEIRMVILGGTTPIKLAILSTTMVVIARVITTMGVVVR